MPNWCTNTCESLPICGKSIRNFRENRQKRRTNDAAGHKKPNLVEPEDGKLEDGKLEDGKLEGKQSVHETSNNQYKPGQSAPEQNMRQPVPVAPSNPHFKNEEDDRAAYQDEFVKFIKIFLAAHVESTIQSVDSQAQNAFNIFEKMLFHDMRDQPVDHSNTYVKEGWSELKKELEAIYQSVIAKVKLVYAGADVLADNQAMDAAENKYSATINAYVNEFVAVVRESQNTTKQTSGKKNSHLEAEIADRAAYQKKFVTYMRSLLTAYVEKISRNVEFQTKIAFDNFNNEIFYDMIHQPVANASHYLEQRWKKLQVGLHDIIMSVGALAYGHTCDNAALNIASEKYETTVGKYVRHFVEEYKLEAQRRAAYIT